MASHDPEINQRWEDGKARALEAVGERWDDDHCPSSQREDGGHCAHADSHDVCDWCGAQWGEGGAMLVPVERLQGAVEDARDAGEASMQAAFWRARAIELGASEDEYRQHVGGQ